MAGAAIVAANAFLASCTADTDAVNLPPTIDTKDATEITRTAAKVSGAITSNGSNVDSYGIRYSSSNDQMLNGTYTELKCDQVFENGKTFTMALNNLKNGTTYYYRTYAISGGTVSYGPAKTLQTPSISAPTLSEPSVSNKTANEATISAEITDKGVDNDVNLELSAPSFKYKRLGAANWSGNVATISQDGNDWQTANAEFDNANQKKFTGKITGLTSSSTYAVYATVTCAGLGRSAIITLVTGETSTPEVSNITCSNAPGDPYGQNINFYASVTNPGKAADGSTATITTRGFVYSETNLTPEVGGNGCTLIGAEGADNRFSASLTGLQNSKTYYIRAYAQNSEGYGYGAVYAHTVAAGLPVPTTVAASDVTTTEATLVGYLEPNDRQIKELGFYLDGSKHIVAGIASGLYQYTATGLAPGSTHSFYAYCITSDNTSYNGSTVSFTMAALGMPVVRTVTCTNITDTSATLIGHVFENNRDVVEYGFILNGEKMFVQNVSNGTYEMQLNNLAPKTTYEVAAFCVTSDGQEHRGNYTTFTTEAPAPTQEDIIFPTTK